MTEAKMAEHLRHEMYCKDTGFTTALEIFPGGQKDGLDYGPVLVEIVVLDNDGSTLAYRISTDSLDEDWEIGQAEDAIEALVAYRKQAEETEQYLAEEEIRYSKE